MSAVFQPVRDGKILHCLYRYRFLQTKLLSLLLEGRNMASVRRRIRALKQMGYVLSFTRLATDEAVYALTTLGFKYIADELGISLRDIPYSRKNSEVRPHFLYHSLSTIKFVVNAEIGAHQHDVLNVVDFLPEWRHQDASARLQEEKYLIKERVSIDKNRSLPCHPDAVSIIDYGGPRVAFYIESDRNSEDMGRILKKFEAYWLLYRQALYKERFGASGMVVLFVLSRIKTERRLNEMLELLRRFVSNAPEAERKEVAAFARRVLFAKEADISVDSVWTQPIWHNLLGEEKALYTPKQNGTSELKEIHQEGPGGAVTTTVIHAA